MIILVLNKARLSAAVKTAADFYGADVDAVINLPTNRSKAAQAARAARGAAIVALAKVFDARAVADRFNLRVATVWQKPHERGEREEDTYLFPAIQRAAETGKPQKVSLPKTNAKPRYFAPEPPSGATGKHIPLPFRQETEAQRVQRVLEAQQKWLPELRRLEADYLNGKYKVAKT